MFRIPLRTGLLPALLLALGLLALYRGPLATGFLNDDYLFLESARTRPLAESLTRLDALGNYWRPLSRQVYFAVLAPVANDHPAVFHAVNFALFLAGLALLADLLGAFATGLSRLAGVVFFALLPFQRVNLMWISCSQDLLALVFSLAGLALWRRGRTGPAAAAYLLALASKETALPLPLAFAAWDVAIGGRPWREAVRRLRPLGAGIAGWIALTLWVRARSHPQPVLEFDPAAIPAAFLHAAQSLLGIDDPPAFPSALASRLPAWAALVPIALAGLAAAAGDARARRGAAAFALAWIALFTLVTWPVTQVWSSYYYTVAAAGAAVLVTLACRNLHRVGWVLLTVGLLWWHAAGGGSRGFSVAISPWVWTSHLTAFYFERAAALTDSLSRNLRRIEPAPAPGTRFFFATLPSFAGFQMGNGALIRTLYRDTTLASHFYSRFSDSTAGDHPCRFYYWDGAALRPMYGGAQDPFFQVGCDLLLLDRPDGATHAFRRALAAGGSPQDNLYWLGWASLWAGDRRSAEAAWSALGAHDDPDAQQARFEAVRTSLYETRDTLAARRQLLETIRLGMGMPNPHAQLGELLLTRGGIETKYGLLELKIAARLNDRDVLARRELAQGLADIGMTDAARDELAALQKTWSDWRQDSTIVALDRRLRPGRAAREPVARFD